MKCEDIKKEFTAFLDNDLEDQKKNEIEGHLNICSSCKQDLEKQKKLSGILQTWKGIEPSPHSFVELESRIESSQSVWDKVFTRTFGKKLAFRFLEVVTIVAFTLVISHWMDKPEQTKTDELSAISLYLTAHQGAVLQTVSDELSPEKETRIPARTEDFMYYEQIDGVPQYTRPGVIFRGPPRSQRETSNPKVPSISKGKILDLPLARMAVDFDPTAPTRLYPGYILDSVRKIDDYNSLHLIYTNGIDTLSLFEQPLYGQNMLAAQDFREYAIYRSNLSAQDLGKTQDKSTILAWRNGSVSFILIGNEEMSRLMEIAQTISTVHKENH